MTSRPEPSSADTKAREIAEKFADENLIEECAMAIAAALREYGEECYHKGFHENIIKHPDTLKEASALREDGEMNMDLITVYQIVNTQAYYHRWTQGQRDQLVAFIMGWV